MEPAYSPVQLLTDLGLGTYAAAAVSLIGFFGFVLTHVMPFIPQPAVTSNGFLIFLWKVGNAITGGYGQAKPSATVLLPATSLQVPPQTLAPTGAQS